MPHRDVGHSFRHQCTSFCLDNNGYAVFGTNYDHGKNIYEGLIFVNKRNISKSYWGSDPVSEHARWTSKYGSVTFNLVMSQFAWAGMNEAGLVISTMELAGSQSPAPDRRLWIYSNYWLQYLLDNYSTIEEVLASDSLLRIKDYVDHYLICDRNGNCATIEFLEGKMVHHTGKNLQVKVLANNTYEQSVAEWDRVRMQKSRGNSVSIQSSSLRRFVLAADRVTEFESTDTKSAVKYAFDVLEEVSGQNVNGSPTLWSIAFDTKNLQIYVHTISYPEVRYINFHDLDFSCRTPVKMLNINEKLSGDITKKLKDYSSKLHFDHAFHARKRWGVDVDLETLKSQIRFLEGLPCEDSPFLTGQYFGQEPPGLSPEIFAPGIVSTVQGEFNAAFSPDGKEFYYSVNEPSGRETMLVMKYIDGRWTSPESASFVSRQNDCDPFFSFDGRRLYFISTRPKKDRTGSRDWDIWYVERIGGTWSEPINIGPPVNSDVDEYYVSLTKDGTIYFASNRAGGLGSFDIYRSRLTDGHYAKPENLGAAINTKYLEHDPFIAPDENYILFTSVDRPGGFGTGDLYISSRKNDGTWKKAKNLGKAFNTNGYDFCPIVSPDGKYFFFTRRGDIYWVSMEVIKKLF